jgi:hypothetical protein
VARGSPHAARPLPRCYGGVGGHHVHDRHQRRPYAKTGDIIRIPQTGEAVRVTGASASALTVVRAIGSVAAATAATGALGGGTLIIVGGSNKQGGSLPTRLITQQTRNYNFPEFSFSLN